MNDDQLLAIIFIIIFIFVSIGRYLRTNYLIKKKK